MAETARQRMTIAEPLARSAGTASHRDPVDALRNAILPVGPDELERATVP